MWIDHHQEDLENIGMNSNWKRVFDSIQKQERLIIGLMSGTSMDGLDIALCAISGCGTGSRVRLLEFKTVVYTNEFKAEIKAIFSKRDADLQLVCIMNEKIAQVHAEMILEALKYWGRTPEEIDAVASHGQTIFHAPRSLHGLSGYPNATMQIGDGDHIAVLTGIVTVSDFRQKHIAGGGEGAPLAVYGDYLLFSKENEHRIMLNIGGIANFTYLPADHDATKVFSTDVGPGNTLMDQYVQKFYEGKYFDKDAAIASSGTVNDLLLNALMQSDFLRADFPKTTGPELFNLRYLESAQTRSKTLHISREDVMATLSSFSAKVIIQAIEKCVERETIPFIYISGGGMHNPLLIKQLKAALTHAVFNSTAQLEINPDAKEAVLFAVLANETLVGKKTNFGSRQGVPSVFMGKICLPE